jgi:uracil-DNA glycosylase
VRRPAGRVRRSGAAYGRVVVPAEPPGVHPSWHAALEPVRGVLAHLEERLRRERDEGVVVLPDSPRVLRALTTPLDRVRVLVVGQDPYPTPGHAVGLAFSVDPAVRPLPPTLRNVLRELVADTGVPAPSTGDLSPWAARGVLLLNRVLTVRAGESGSHRRIGWERVTDAVVRALAGRGGPLVSVLWGRDAQTVAPLLAGTAVVTGVHPSPLSASRGFVGSRPFTAVDELLRAQGAPAVDWSLP